MAVWGPDIENDPKGFNRLESFNIPYEILPIHRNPTLDSLRRFRGILKSFKPDVVECFKSGAQYHALFGGIGLHKHALIFYRGISQPMDFWQGLKYRLNRVDRVIANSEALKRIMVATGRIPSAKIDCIYGEFDPSCGDQDAVDASGVKSELGIPEGVPLLVQIGNWAPWRGQNMTIEAASLLKAKGISFHLLFAGRETDKLKARVQELNLTDIITLSPYRRDPERILKIASITINPSTGHESLSGALINAQAMGVPAVVSRLSGSPEIVEDGVTGYLVPPGDAKALAERLAIMLEMDGEQLSVMGKAARLRALKLFSSEIRTERRLEVYRKAIEHRKAM